MTRVLALCLALAACQRATHDKPAPPESRKGQRHAPETILYVDGAPRASLAFAEALHPATRPLCAFLGDVGVACPTVRAVHLYAPAGAVTPLGDPGGALLELEPGAAPRVGGTEVRAVTVYVDKPAPSLPVDGIPYLSEKVRGGTRVNLDGRLVARLKRNQLEGDSPNGYALADFLSQRQLGAPRAVELVTADGQVVRVPDAEIANVTFDAEPEKHGQMSFRFAGRAISTVAVNLYQAASPPPRDEAQPALVAPAPARAGFSAGCSVVW